jgi:hypothetical protein
MTAFELVLDLYSIQNECFVEWTKTYDMAPKMVEFDLSNKTIKRFYKNFLLNKYKCLGIITLTTKFDDLGKCHDDIESSAKETYKKLTVELYTKLFIINWAEECITHFNKYGHFDNTKLLYQFKKFACPYFDMTNDDSMYIICQTLLAEEVKIYYYVKNIENVKNLKKLCDDITFNVYHYFVINFSDRLYTCDQIAGFNTVDKDMNEKNIHTFVKDDICISDEDLKKILSERSIENVKTQMKKLLPFIKIANYT